MREKKAASSERSLERIAEAQELYVDGVLKMLEYIEDQFAQTVRFLERMSLAFEKLAQYQTGPRFQNLKIGRHSYDGWQLWCFKHGPFFSEDPRLEKAACPHCGKEER